MAIKHVSFYESRKPVRIEFEIINILDIILKVVNHLLDRVLYIILNAFLPGFHALLEVLEGVGCKLNMRYKKLS